jgi:uncharacterized protein (DUF433 family)
MMSELAKDSLVGRGLYTISEAAALTGASAQAIRRWVFGYQFRLGDRGRDMPSVWKAEIGNVDGHKVLSFLDLMEVRFIVAFRKQRVSWAAIREAATLACQMFEDSHPFTRRRFRTDGKRIFQQVEERPQTRLFDMNRKAWVFNEIVGPSLYSGVEFVKDQTARWYPTWPKKTVVIDPQIGFGRPTVSRGNVPTEVLAASARAEGSASAAARWYRVAPSIVKAAIEFEERLAA